jgi:hypothetical protein
MAYNLIQPPFTLEFFKMSKPELKEYFDWFIASIPERIAELEKAVTEMPGYRTWKADYTPESLNKLGEWFVTQVEVRPRTAEEKLEELKSMKFPFVGDIPNEQLNERTISLVIDIAMYLAKTFQAKYGHIEWHQRLENKKFIDYGQPLLKGFGPVSLNPVGVMLTLAITIAHRETSGQGLREVYDIWSKKARAGMH